MEVFVVQHAYPLEDEEGDEQIRFLGVYTSRRLADEAVARFVERPGFSAHPNGFRIDPYEMDKDHWTDGFTTP